MSPAFPSISVSFAVINKLICSNGKVKFGGKKFEIIILGLSHKVCCLLPSPSYCEMVRFTADSFPIDCQSTIIFQRGKCGQGESVARVRSKYKMTGNE